jgi:anti-sigma regulatory factor (Ser/Thr protein kinase)
MHLSACPEILLTRRPMALPASFDLSFAPTPSIVSVVRRFVRALYDRILEDGDLSDQLALATHELLDNAVKYCIDDETSLRVTLQPQDGEFSAITVVIRTRNRATPENIHTVTRIITEVRDASDPFMFYQQLLTATAEQAEGSGLGIARIRAETAMTVDCRVDGDALEILAQASVRVGGDP